MSMSQAQLVIGFGLLKVVSVKFTVSGGAPTVGVAVKLGYTPTEGL